MTFDDFSDVMNMITDLLCVRWIPVFSYHVSLLEVLVGSAVLTIIISLAVDLLD